MPTEKQKVVTLPVLAAALDEVEQRYATKEELAAGAPDIEFATEDDVHAIFAKYASGGSDEPAEDNGEGPAT